MANLDTPNIAKYQCDQLDITQYVDWGLKELRPEVKPGADGVKHYSYDASVSMPADISLSGVDVCPKPHWFNSHAHVVSFAAKFNGCDVAMAAEEIETAACMTYSQNVYIGFDETDPRCAPLKSDEDAHLLLDATLWLALGAAHDPQVIAPTKEGEAPRYFLRRVSRDEVLSKGCELSLMANGCFMNWPGVAASRTGDLLGLIFDSISKAIDRLF